MRIRVSAWLGLGVALGAFALGSPARAQSGTHAPAVSTYDTRASSVVFAYRHGFSTAGSFNTFSYNANFTSTTGRLSAQFGIHYVNYKESGYDTRAHGIGGSGVAVLEYPVAGRWEDGVPKAALALHLGGVPTAYISGERNFLTVPFVLGLGVPLSPHRVVTFTPWYELAIAANVDTIVRPEGVTIDSSSVVFDPQTQTASLKPGAVETALRQGVTIDVGVTVPMRAGLQGTLHLGRSADLDLYGMLSTLGGAFSGTSVKTVGAALVVRWDDIVPAVLPKRDAEPPESCEAIERRFRACPSSRHWLTPEQRGLSPAAAGTSPPSTIPPSKAPVAPPPAPPAKPPSAPAAPPVPPPTPTASSSPAANPNPSPEPSPPANSQFPTP